MPVLHCSSDVTEIRNRFNVVVDGLPDWLREHTRRVVEAAVELADAHGLDPDVCAAAATGHDIFRHLAPEELLARSLERQIDVGEVERAAPIILHGPLAANHAAAELGIAHPAILQAIRFHTTCHADLGAEGLAVFAADKIEPAKLERDPGLAPVAEAARRDLRCAAALFLERRMRKQLKRGELLHPLSVAARNAFRAGPADG